MCVRCPGSDRTPRSDWPARDHWETSTASLRITFHRADLLPGCFRPPTRKGMVLIRAFFIHWARGSAFACSPMCSNKKPRRCAEGRLSLRRAVSARCRGSIRSASSERTVAMLLSPPACLGYRSRSSAVVSGVEMRMVPVSVLCSMVSLRLMFFLSRKRIFERPAVAGLIWRLVST